MNGETTEATATNERRARKPPRPEIQIYRPGALRKGDSTKSLAPAEQQQPQQPQPPIQRPEKLESGFRRRRSNDTDSVTSRGGSGSTTPDANAMNERGKQRFGGNSGGYNQHDRRDGGGSSYNSTQSLYDTRRQGGYTEYNGNRSNRSGGRHQNQNQRPQFERPGNHNRNFNERASMRGDASITKRLQGGRRRNDSINSTQSEMPPSSANEALHVDTNYDSVSQCGASSAFSMNSLGEAFSFEEMRQNLQNFASMDWSKEVEEEFAMQKEMEEEEERERQRMEAAQKASVEVVKQNHQQNHHQNQRGPPRLQEANGQTQHSPRKPRHRRNRRHDESDRESSFGGSIAEENEEEEELKSGERTPTSTRSSIPAFNPRVLYQRAQRGNNENNGYVRRGKEPAVAPQQPSRKGYRGEHDDRDDDSSQYEAIEQHMSTGRLAGRVSFVPRDAPEDRNRGRQRADESPKKHQKRSPPTEMPTREEKHKERELEIQKNEGPRISELDTKMKQLEDSVRKKKDESSAKKLIDIGLKLAEVYAEMIFPDVIYAFNERLEIRLFRSTFHRLNELFRRVCNTASSDTFKIRARAIGMLQSAIVFYENLITRYQERFAFDLETALVWPNGVPTDEQLMGCSVKFPFGMHKYDSSTSKTAIKSLSRHLTSLGDLYRYKSIFSGSESYEESKGWYLKAAQLWPAFGHPYHQIGVVVHYSNRVTDEFFFLMRALSSKHVYPAARDRLTERLAAMRRKVEKYQPVLDKECGIARKERAQLARIEMIQQMWIHPITHKVETGTGDKIVSDMLSHFVEQPKVRLHRRGVSYLCDTFGLLVTKIGMDHFGSVSERAFGHLFAALIQPTTDFSAYQLVQLSAMFIYAVHVNHTKPDGQLDIAFNTLVTYLTVLIQAVFAEKRLVLPAINVISTWLCCKETEKILERIKTCETFPSTVLVEFNGKNTLEKVLERYSGEEGELVEKQEGYPEIVFLTSFINCWESIPESSMQSKDGDLDKGRLVQLRAAMSKLSSKMVEEPIEVMEERLREEEKEEEESPRGREELIEEGRWKGKRQLLIHPDYLIPDTNVFIDALPRITHLLEMQKFQILVPTRVVDELSRISRLTQNSPEHDAERVTKAKRAMDWLGEQSRLKTPNLHTLTTTGKRLATLELKSGEVTGVTMAYDDQILQSGLEWTKKLPAPAAASILAEIGASTTESDQQTILRQCVLLTGDRGLTIKAICGNLPCRKIVNFSNWVSSVV